MVSDLDSVGGLMRRVVLAAALAFGVLAAGCSSSGSVGGPTGSQSVDDQIGRVQAPSSPKPAAAPVALGASITKGALKIAISGPVTAKKSGGTGPGLIVTFQVSMTNTSTTGEVEGPWAYGIRCDANRTGEIGDWWTSTTAANKKIPAGQTLTGTADVTWLKWDSFTKCTGPTEIDANWTGISFLAWMVPDDVVAKVNAAGA